MKKKDRFALILSSVNAFMLLLTFYICYTDDSRYKMAALLSGIFPLGVMTLSNLVLFIVFALKREKNRMLVALIWTLVFPLIGYSTCTWYANQ